MGLYFPKLQWKYSMPRQKASHWSTTRCWKQPVVLFFNHNFIHRVSGVMVQKWDGLQGAESGARMEMQAPGIGRAQIFPVLYHTWNLLGNLSVIQLLFLFCFVLVLYMFSMAKVLLFQQSDTISPAHDHAVRGLAALRLLESLKMWLLFLGLWGARAGPAPCGVWGDFPKQVDSPDVHICCWCSSDFGWLKKSRKGLNLSSCGHQVSGFFSAFRPS